MEFVLPLSVLIYCITETIPKVVLKHQVKKLQLMEQAKILHYKRELEKHDAERIFYKG